jgi:hypothetical protein
LCHQVSLRLKLVRPNPLGLQQPSFESYHLKTFYMQLTYIYYITREAFRQGGYGSYVQLFKTNKVAITCIFAGLGFEPRQAASKAAVLPLDDPAIADEFYQ